jgi:hypothetical protein
MTPGLSIGAKRNRGCQLARGSIIAQWDDDRYAPGRLCAQMAPILAGEAHISGLKAEAFFKRFWEEHRFPDLNEGWDTMFVWGLTDANVVPLANHTFYIGTVHRHHSSPKKTDSLGWHTFPVQEIRRLLRATWSFYEG